jgi:hypothetical protein
MFSSLVKQNTKAKFCFVIHIAGEKKLLFYICAVIVKQFFYKLSSNCYSHTHYYYSHTHAHAHTHTHTYTHKHTHAHTHHLGSMYAHASMYV